MSLAGKTAVGLTGAPALASLSCSIRFLTEVRAWVREARTPTQSRP